MSNYITTNIRIFEDDYLRLKEEAARNRKSFAAVVREKISANGSQSRSADEIMARTKKLAQKNAKKLQGIDIVKILREMRYKGKW